jgi:hypothetical protein
LKLFSKEVLGVLAFHVVDMAVMVAAQWYLGRWILSFSNWRKGSGELDVRRMSSILLFVPFQEEIVFR